MDAAIVHCTAGIGNLGGPAPDRGSEPDVVLACCGDGAHSRDLAEVESCVGLPELKVRVIKYVDLMRIQPASGTSARI